MLDQNTIIVPVSLSPCWECTLHSILQAEQAEKAEQAYSALSALWSCKVKPLWSQRRAERVGRLCGCLSVGFIKEGTHIQKASCIYIIFTEVAGV